MSFKEFQDEIEYDLTFDNGLAISGKYSLIKPHIGKFEGEKLSISMWQPVSIRPIMQKYIDAFGVNPTYITEEWYEANK